jgi:hypothetical protein
VKYRLRTSVVSKLLHRYASWHSRPGIVEFSSQLQAGTFLYYAYGSNMLTSRLKSRAPSATKVGVGTLSGHILAFDKSSADGSAKCDIKRTGKEGDVVHGVLFMVDAKDKEGLDKAEGLGYGYADQVVTVTTASGVCTAKTFPVSPVRLVR